MHRVADRPKMQEMQCDVIFLESQKTLAPKLPPVFLSPKSELAASHSLKVAQQIVSGFHKCIATLIP